MHMVDRNDVIRPCFRGGGGADTWSKTLDFDCTMNAFFVERKNGAVVDAESWGQYVTVTRQISTLSKLGPNSDYGVSCSNAFAIIYQQHNSMVVK